MVGDRDFAAIVGRRREYLALQAFDQRDTAATVRQGSDKAQADRTRTNQNRSNDMRISP